VFSEGKPIVFVFIVLSAVTDVKRAAAGHPVLSRCTITEAA
jgi:hypothetical protein